jgi:chromosome segregation ATPase
VERLQRDLSRRDRELEEERAESERGLERVQKLERDKVELKRELEDVRDEASEYQRLVEELQQQIQTLEDQKGVKRKGDQVGEEDREDTEDLVRDLQYEINDKNREIGALVEDLEVYFINVWL